MSFGRNSGSRLALSQRAERVLTGLAVLTAMGLVYALFALLSCAFGAWCPP